MQFKIRYWKTRGRMPVRSQVPVYMGDRQQEIPVGWCVLCRRELYDPKKEMCRRCEGVNVYESRESVLQMYPGERPH